MNINKKELLESLSIEIDKCSNLNDLTIVKNTFSKKHITPLYDLIKSASLADKGKVGTIINEFKNSFLALCEERELSIENIQQDFQHNVIADVSIDSADYRQGSLSPISIVSHKIISFFSKLNFDIVNGSEVVSTKLNFDYLNIPEDHPGRQTSETFYFNPEQILRAHCTSSSAEQIHKQSNKDEIKVLSYGNVYRNDDDDMTHSHQFNQIDLIWAKKGLSISNLKWLLQSLLNYLYEKEIKTRFRLSFFPFTEPSIEVDISCQKCEGKGCAICKKSGWIEILGAGMLHPNVMKKAGIENKQVIALGIGVDRIAMIKYQISDIRDIYSNNFKFIEQFRTEVE